MNLEDQLCNSWGCFSCYTIKCSEKIATFCKLINCCASLHLLLPRTTNLHRVGINPQRTVGNKVFLVTNKMYYLRIDREFVMPSSWSSRSLCCDVKSRITNYELACNVKRYHGTVKWVKVSRTQSLTRRIQQKNFITNRWLIEIISREWKGYP